MQSQSEQINELATALAKAQGEMQHAKKAEDNPYFKSKYADLASCMDAARPHLSKHGLSITQPIEVDDNGKLWIVTHLLHASGQWMSSKYPVNPVKNDPQGIGSAVTYARRYAYCAVVGVAAAGEDDDGNAASDHIPQATPKEAKETARARNQRWEAIKKEILDAETLDQLQTTWATNYTHVQAFGGELADELIRHKDKRKLELTKAAEQDELLKSGFPADFNNVR